MTNHIGTIFLMVWFAVCTWFVFRTDTFLKAWKIGFISSWIGMIVTSFIIGVFMSAQGGMGVHGIFAILTGWIPCLSGAFVMASGRTLLAKHIVRNQYQKERRKKLVFLVGCLLYISLWIASIWLQESSKSPRLTSHWRMEQKRAMWSAISATRSFYEEKGRFPSTIEELATANGDKNPNMESRTYSYSQGKMVLANPPAFSVKSRRARWLFFWQEEFPSRDLLGTVLRPFRYDGRTYFDKSPWIRIHYFNPSNPDDSSPWAFLSPFPTVVDYEGFGRWGITKEKLLKICQEGDWEKELFVPEKEIEQKFPDLPTPREVKNKVEPVDAEGPPIVGPRS